MESFALSFPPFRRGLPDSSLRRAIQVNRSDILAVCRTILKNESKMKFATLSNDSQKRQIEAGERPEYFLSKVVEGKNTASLPRWERITVVSIEFGF